MAAELIHIPFVSGTREDIDEKVLPIGSFESITDARLLLTGKLGPRRRYTALSADAQPVVVGSAGAPDVAPLFRATQAVDHDGKLLAFGVVGGVSGQDPVEPALVRPRSLAVWNDAGFWATPSQATEGGMLFRHAGVESFTTLPPGDRAAVPRVRVAATDALVGIARTTSVGACEFLVCDAQTGAVVANLTRPAPSGVGCNVAAVADGRLLFLSIDSTANQLSCVYYSPGIGFGAPFASVTTTLASPANGGVELCSTPTGIAIAIGSAVSASDSATIGHFTPFGGLLNAVWTSTIAACRRPRPAASSTHIFWSAGIAGNNISVRRDLLASSVGTSFNITSASADFPAPMLLDGSGKLHILYAPIAGNINRGTWNFPGSTWSTPNDTQTIDLPTYTSGMWLDAFGAPQVAMRPRTPSVSLFASSTAFIGGRGVFYSTQTATPHQGYSFRIAAGEVALHNDVPASAQVGSTVYAVVYMSDELSSGSGSVYAKIYRWRVTAAEDEWHSTAMLGGALYVANGTPQQFDGSRLIESGWQLPPSAGFNSATPQAGAVTPGVHQYMVQFRWRDALGDVHESALSQAFPVTTAAESIVNLTVSSHRSQRGISRDSAAPTVSPVEVAVYRTKAAPDTVFRRVPGSSLVINIDPVNPIATILIADLAPDSLLDDAPFLDTGLIESPPSSPAPCDAIWSGRDRLFSISPAGYQVSRKLEQGKTVHWSPLSAFSGRVEGRPRAIWSLDDLIVIATDSQLWGLAGEGPDAVGNGGFGAPTRIPGAVGCMHQRTVVQDSQGVWFIDTTGRLYHQARGTGPVWRGEPVRQTLAEYPHVVGAAYCRHENTVNWLLKNGAGQARMVAYDTRADCWYVDTLEEVGGEPSCLAEWRDRLVIVADGVVYAQEAASHADGARYRFRMNVAPFGADGWGSLCRYSLTGSSRAGSTVTSSIQYSDDTSAELGEGQTETLSGVRDNGYEWAPRRRKGVRFRLDFDVQGTGAAYEATALTLKVKPIRGAGRKSQERRR